MRQVSIWAAKTQLNLYSPEWNPVGYVIESNLQQVAKVIWQQGASPPHMDGSLVFARCASVHPIQYILPWAHQSPNRKRHLDRFSHLCTKHWWPILSAWYTCKVDAYSTLCVTLQCDCIVSHRMVLYTVFGAVATLNLQRTYRVSESRFHHDAACDPRFRAIGSHM